jgi:hypothetical protein
MYSREIDFEIEVGGVRTLQYQQVDVETVARFLKLMLVEVKLPIDMAVGGNCEEPTDEKPRPILAVCEMEAAIEQQPNAAPPISHGRRVDS